MQGLICIITVDFIANYRSTVGDFHEITDFCLLDEHKMSNTEKNLPKLPYLYQRPNIGKHRILHAPCMVEKFWSVSC